MGPHGRAGPLVLQQRFLLDRRITFLNHGSFGACPRPVFESYQNWQNRLEQQPVRFMLDEIFNHLRNSREMLGAYLNCSGDDLVFVPNPTTAVNTVMRSLTLEPGDEILSTNHEYGALVRAWKKFSGETGTRFIQRQIELPVTTKEVFVDQFLAGVSEKTRVIFISQITSPTALIFPVQEICARARELGLFTIIDGAHVPGHIPLNISEIDPDIYTGACHKWLCAPKGCSFLYVRREVQPRIQPLVTSWGLEIRKNNESAFIAEHEWQGTRDLSAYLTIPSAIKFQDEYLTETVKKDCRKLTREARDRLLDLTGTEPLCPGDETWLGQMASVEIPVKNPNDFGQMLFSKYRIEIPVFAWESRHFLRISVQAYNNREQIEALLMAVNTLL